MKKLLVAALLVVGITAFAQEKEGRKSKRENLTSEQKVDLYVKKITTDLDLNEKQAAEVKILATKQVQKKEAKKAEMKANRDKQREDMKANMEKNEMALSSDMKKILTPEQFAKWEKIRIEKKSRMKERIQERRERKDSK